MQLSVVLATRNEEASIGTCLDSVKKIADEIVIVDEKSSDKTRSIAEKYGARVYEVDHEEIFHKTKQKALDLARGDWILQLDADEVVTKKLSDEIKRVILMSTSELNNYRWEVLEKNSLFKKHEQIVEARDGKIGKNTGDIVAFFIPRLNLFLGKPLKHAGVYPDGVIRLFKKDKAWFPAKSVHEQIQIEGEVGWLQNNLEHNDSPTLSKYLSRLNRYTDLHATDLSDRKVSKNFLNLLFYSIILPVLVFLNLYFQHKGLLDGPRGFLWSFFSASHYPIAYFKYYQRR